MYESEKIIDWKTIHRVVANPRPAKLGGDITNGKVTFVNDFKLKSVPNEFLI